MDVLGDALLAAVPVGALLAALVLGNWIQGVGEAAAAGAVLLAAATRVLIRRPRIPRPAAIVSAIAGASVAWIVVASVLSVDPRASLAGTLGAPFGATFWLVGWSAFALGVLWGTPRAARWLAFALTAAGAVLGAIVLLERAGGRPFDNVMAPEPTALLGESALVAQMLVIGLGCAFTSWRWSESKMVKRLSIGCGAVMACGMGLSGSRAGVLVMAAVSLGLALTLRGGASRSRILAIAATAGVVLAIVGVAVIGSLSARSAVRPALDSVLNYRPVVWSAAWNRAADNLVPGQGPNLFSSVGEWKLRANDPLGVDARGTYASHSLLLDMLLAGGLVAVAVGALAVLAWGWAVTPKLARVDASSPVWGYALGLAGFVLLALVDLVHPVTAVPAGLAAGILLAWAAPRAQEDTTATTLGLAGALAVSAAGVLLLSVTPFVVGMQSLPVAEGPAYDVPPFLTRAYQATGDPMYAHSLLLATGDSARDGGAGARDALLDATRLTERVASWHYTTAVDLAWAWTIIGGQGEAAGFRRAIDAGRAADPRTTLWDYLSAKRAEIEGDESAAVGFARAALDGRYLPADARRELEEIAKR